MEKTETIKRRMAFVMGLLLAFVVFSEMQARSWRINSNASRKAHFLDLNAAMASDDVLAGDTLYLDPGCQITTRQDVTKRVTIIGTGYFLPNANDEANISGAVYLKATKTKMEGVQTTGTVYLGANDIVLERCKFGGVRCSDTAQRATIRQCFFPNGQIAGDGSTSTKSDHWLIENCIVIYTSGYYPVKDLYYPTIRNNYLRPNYSSASSAVANINNGTIVNNIFINTKYANKADPYSVTDCVITNNVFHCSSVQSTYPDNVYIGSNTEEAVFALEGENDQRYYLKEGSPAIGQATDGGDIGPTGGMFPYVCGGFPFGMPRFESDAVGLRPNDRKVKVSQKVTIQNQ